MAESPTPSGAWRLICSHVAAAPLPPAMSPAATARSAGQGTSRTTRHAAFISLFPYAPSLPTVCSSALTLTPVQSSWVST